jgi:hypothetical protein
MPGALAVFTLTSWLALSSGCAPRPSVVTALTPPQAPAVEAGDAAIACDPRNHDVLLCWVAGDSSRFRVWFARSTDRGATWSPPVAVTPENEPLRMQPESSPRLVCESDGHIGIAWSTSVEIAGRRLPASDVRFSGSADGGRTWSTAVTINDDTASGPGSHAFHALAVRLNGALYAAWLDSRPGADSIATDESDDPDASIHFARSDDHGATWDKNLSQWSRVCPRCRVSLAVDPAGNPYSAFRKHYPGQVRDIVVGRPSFAPQRLYKDDWRVGDCPQSGPPLVLSRDGSLRIAWFTGAEGRAGVYFRQVMPDMMDSTAKPVAVMVSAKLPTVHVDVGEAGMSGSLIACDADSTGTDQLTLARVESSGRRLVERFVVPGTRGVSYPKVATAMNGRLAYVVWSTHEGGHGELRMARWDVGH